MLRGVVWSALLPCPGCGRRPASDHGACPRCWAAIDAGTRAERQRDLGVRTGDRPAGVSGAADASGDLVALGPYRGRLGKLVRSAKYRPSTALIAALGRRLGARVRTRWPAERAWLVVPVPPDPGRRRQRGLDHAAVLAAALAAALDPPRPPLAALARRRPTAPQSRVARPAREANLRGAIAARPVAVDALRGAQVLLIDDVSTSGATLRACRTALVTAGALRVRAAVVARAG